MVLVVPCIIQVPSTKFLLRKQRLKRSRHEG
ncbi:rCG50535 [Rattus norvegicus]|uniref:RCG50535 n=1 Tax=Rattus norvegicus TaxID=10116 RepID=A6KCX1_RAT|nr:rCG50535 [Rattus norvegicus]